MYNQSPFRCLSFLAGIAISIVISTCIIHARTFPRVNGYIPNKGQWPSEVIFLSRQPNLDVWVTWTGVVYDQYLIKDNVRRGHVLRMKWENASAMPKIEVKYATPAQALSETSVCSFSFFKGSDRSKWITDASTCSEVRLRDLYPGIDLIYYLDEGGRVRYDLDVQPNANVSQVGFTVEGDLGLNIAPTEVSLSTSLGTVAMTDLYAYVLGRKSLGIPATFVANSNGISFSIPMNTGKVPLRVDPVVYGTYLGGDASDVVKAIKTVSNGVFVGGTTASLDFPQDVGAYSTSVNGESDAFIAKLSLDLSEVVTYTYFGGGDADRLADITIDYDGNVCATGETSSSDLPTSIGAVGQIYKGQIDGFILKMPATLNNITISTYIGGNKDDKPKAIAAEVNGTLFVAGSTTSTSGFPVVGAHQSSLGGETDGFLARLSVTGGSYLFSTYYGKAGNESFSALALDDAASPYVTGSTTSSDFETAPTPGRFASGRVPYDRSYNGGNTDAFLIKFFPDGTLSKRDDGTFATFFGGNNDEEGRGIFVDPTGRPVLVGVSTSTNLPAAATLYTQLIGKRDIFMAVFTDDGRGLVSCTYYGGTGDDDVFGMIPRTGSTSGILFGSTTSNDFPTYGSGSISERRGTSDAFIAEFNTSTNIFSTLITGQLSDTIIDLVSDSKADIYYAWTGTSEDMFVHSKALQSVKADQQDGYIGKWAHGTLTLATPSGGENWCAGTTRSITWAADGMNDNETYDLSLSSDNGITWNPLSTSLKQLNYNWKIPATIEGGSGFRIKVSTTRGHVQESNSFTIAAPPSITEQPVGTRNCLGTAYTLSVVASGSNLRYQWRKDGVNIGGAVNSQYLIPALSPGTAGKYDVVVSGACSPTATSTSTDVSIAPATAISTQPSGSTIKVGEQFTVSVVATGSGLRYQWQLNNYDIADATKATYSVSSVEMSDAGNYSVVVRGDCGEVSSEEAVLIVNPQSYVKEDPTNDATTIRIIGPNPATTDFTVELTLVSSDKVVINLVDQRGAIVWSSNEMITPAGPSVYRVPVAELGSGVYVIEAIVGKTTHHGIITVAH